MKVYNTLQQVMELQHLKVCNISTKDTNFRHVMSYLMKCIDIDMFRLFSTVWTLGCGNQLFKSCLLFEQNEQKAMKGYLQGKFVMSVKNEEMDCGMVEVVKCSIIKQFDHLERMRENETAKRIKESRVDLCM